MGVALCYVYTFYFFQSWFHTYLVKARGYREKDLLLSSLPFFVAAGVNVTGGLVRLPVVLKSQAYQERVSVKIPEGFKVDEIPDAIKLSTPYGAYEAKWAFKDGAVEFTRRLESKALTVPPEEYPAVLRRGARRRGATGGAGAAVKKTAALTVWPLAGARPRPPTSIPCLAQAQSSRGAS